MKKKPTNKKITYTSRASEITYWLEPIDGINFDDGIMVSSMPKGEIYPNKRFAVEPELLFILADAYHENFYGSSWDSSLDDWQIQIFGWPRNKESDDQ